MADELISREALLRDIHNNVVFSGRSDRPNAEIRGANKIIDRINAAPTINPESLRPKGEWKVYLGGKELMCTACQATFWDEDGNGGSDFCPNCGADMRGRKYEY